jgi:hypothetical protein
LAYINRECLNNELILKPEQKKDIIVIVKKLVSKNNIKYINSLRSLKPLIDILNISIVSAGEGFRVR